jgi:hypothetical protein
MALGQQSWISAVLLQIQVYGRMFVTANSKSLSIIRILAHEAQDNSQASKPSWATWSRPGALRTTIRNPGSAQSPAALAPVLEDVRAISWWRRWRQFSPLSRAFKPNRTEYFRQSRGVHNAMIKARYGSNDCPAMGPNIDIAINHLFSMGRPGASLTMGSRSIRRHGVVKEFPHVDRLYSCANF